MKIQILASGSSGNCTILKSGKTYILLDAGIKFKTIQQALNFKNPTAALITHEHGDHAHKPTVNELLRRGVEVYAPKSTIDALNLPKRHNLHSITAFENLYVGGLFVEPVAADHDVECVSFFVTDKAGDCAGYVVDTGTVDLPLACKKDSLTALMIEANYSEPRLAAAATEPSRKERIQRSHLSIEQVLALLRISWLDLPRLKDIYLMHISKQNGDGAEFKAMVERMIPEWRLTVHIGAEQK